MGDTSLELAVQKKLFSNKKEKALFIYGLNYF